MFPWITFLTAIAALGLTLALQRSDLSLEYVAEHTTTNLPTLYKAAAIFSGAAGSGLVFALIVTACAAAATTPVARAPVHWGLRALALLVFGALVWSTLGAPPFARVPWQLADGRGLDPRLQNPLLFTQQPLLMLGYALTLVGAAIAFDAKRREQLSRWTFAAWICELLALLLGAASAFAVAAILLTTLLLLLPPLRRQWWPATRRGVLALTLSTAFAVLFAALGVIGAGLAREYSVSLGQGASAQLRDAFGRQWTLAHEGVSVFRSENREVTAVTIEAARDAAERALLVTERRQSVDSKGEEIAEPVVVPGRRHGLAQEIAVRLVRLQPENAAELGVEFTPFKSGVRLAYLLLFGTGLLLWIGAIRRGPNVRSLPDDAGPEQAV